MELFKRLSTSVFAPNEIKDFKDDKFRYLLFFIVFFLIMNLIPFVYRVANADPFDYHTKQTVQKMFEKEEIEFAIVDEKLVNKNTAVDTQVYDLTTTKLAFTTNKSNLELSTIPIIVFGNYGVTLQMLKVEMNLFTYGDYPGLENIDFAAASDFVNQDFWNVIQNVVDTEYNNLKPFILTSTIIGFAMGFIITLLLYSLLIVLFQRIRLQNLIKFRQLWKLSIYCLAPFFVGQAVSRLFDIGSLTFITLFISLIYGSIMTRSIIRDRGHNNEL